MKLMIKLFGILLILLGLALLIDREIIFGWLQTSLENTSLYIFAISVRLVLGIIFILAATKSKYPKVIQIFGYLFIIGAGYLILMGQEGFLNFITSLLPDIKPFTPVSAVLSIVFGGFLIYAFSRKRESGQA